MHVAIAGNIGAGKTTLTELLANHYRWNSHFETVERQNKQTQITRRCAHCLTKQLKTSEMLPIKK